jgi:hypothetical protein
MPIPTPIRTPAWADAQGKASKARAAMIEMRLTFIEEPPLQWFLGGAQICWFLKIGRFRVGTLAIPQKVSRREI